MKDVIELLEEAQKSSVGKPLEERLKIMQDHAKCDYGTVIDFLSRQSRGIIID